MAQKRVTKRKVKKKSKLNWLLLTQYLPNPPKIKLKSVVYVFFLLSFLLFSLAALTYVVFFRTVVAAELPGGGAVTAPRATSLSTPPSYGCCPKMVRNKGVFLPVNKQQLSVRS